MTLDGSGTGKARVVLPSAQPIYAAARRWRDEALIGDRSLFDGRVIDGAAVTDGLMTHYVNNPEEGEGTFTSKLKFQLRNASPDTIQVAAELMYVHCLITSTDAMKGKSKAELVEAILGFRDSGTSGLPDDLREALRAGVARPGQAYNNLRWKMFRYLVRVFAEVKKLAPEDRPSALASPESFDRLVSEIDEQSVWTQRFALEHLLFPDDCPAILSREDRVVQLQKLGHDGETINDVIRRLPSNVFYGDRSAVNLYRTPFSESWRGLSANLQQYAKWAKRVHESIDLDEQERSYKLDRVPGFAEAFEEASAGRDPTQRLRAALQGLNLVDYRVLDDYLRWSGENPDVSGEALRELAKQPGPESMDRFLQYVPRDKQLSGIGARISLGSTLLMGLQPEQLPPWRDTQYQQTVRLTGGYNPQEAATAGERYLLFLERLDVIIAALASVDVAIADRLDAQGLAWAVATWSPGESWPTDEAEEFLAWRDGRPLVKHPSPDEPTNLSKDSENPAPPHNKAVPSSVEALAESLMFAPEDVGWLHETIDLLAAKRQLILQGPPGTGKTYVGRAVANFVAGDPSRVDIVQFHPSYAYEDFVAGLRPDPNKPSEFTVVKGPFVALAERARQAPEQVFVLLIDEINRGNIPSIFGELYFLLEYRDSAIRMSYGEDTFSLPENVLILGTMNTADRSITSLDSALRRRFFVRTLRPGENPLAGLLRRFLTDAAPDLLWLADLLDLANERINDPDQSIGPSHFLDPEVSELSARRAWDNAVVPMLTELFYAQPDRVPELTFDVLKIAVTGNDDDAAD